MIEKTAYRVHFYDTDAMAVVHHANYIRWFEIGRVEFLRSAGISLNELMDDNYVFPITDVEAKYHAPAHYDDELVIITRPLALTKAKMEFAYEIRRKSDDVLLVTGRTQNVFTKKDTGQITRLTQNYYEKLQKAMEPSS